MKLVSKFHRIFSKKKYNPYHHTYIKFNALRVWICTATLASLCLVVYLYRINFGYCDEHTIRKTMRNICNQYYRSQVSGPLCEIMCAKEIFLQQPPEDQTKGYYCPNKSFRQRALLIGTTGDGYNYYLKEAESTILGPEQELEPIKWYGQGGKPHYPTEEEFLSMVNTTIYFHYNLTMSEEKLKKLLNYKQNGSYEKLHNFMENMWRLVHDNDFVMVQLNSHREFFPNVIGHCGPYYATEYINPFQTSSGHLERISLQDWKQRLQRIILIMDYVDEVSNMKIAMCDIRFNMFGRQDSTIKYLDLEHVHPTYYIERKLSDMRPCWKDLHCGYKHCKTRCDKDLGKCTTRQLNNNYQVLCDVVLRGTTYSPGLLITSRATKKLLDLLDRCADPKASFDIDLTRPMGPAKQLFDQVRAEIINMYDGLTSVA